MIKLVFLVGAVATLSCVNAQGSKPIAAASPSPTPGYKPTPAPASGSSVAAATTASSVQNPFNLTFVVSAKDLPNKSKTSKVDPYIKVFHRTGSTEKGTDWTLIGQTDTIKDNENPDFNNVFSFVWTRGKNQVLHFEVKDKDTYNKDDAVGQIDIPVDAYVDKNQDYTVKLSDGGSITVKKTTPVNFSLYARNLPKMDQFGGASDPYVLVNWRRGKDGTDVPIGTGRTETIDNVENADWKDKFEFSNWQKGTNQYWHFIVKDSDSVSGDDDLGEVFVEVDPFLEKRAAKINKLATDSTSANKGTLAVTPA